MAYSDYILCEKCGEKIVYDGKCALRERLLERFGTDELCCPECLVLERASARTTTKNIIAVWHDRYTRTLASAIRSRKTKPKDSRS